MQHFSHVALVLEHRHKLYVAFMSTGGLECLPARRWFKRLLISKTEVRMTCAYCHVVIYIVV